RAAHRVPPPLPTRRSSDLRRTSRGQTPLIALDVVDTRAERSAVFSLFTIGAIGSGLTFLIPLYIQVVQGGTGLDTAAAVIPFSLDRKSTRLNSSHVKISYA